VPFDASREYLMIKHDPATNSVVWATAPASGGAPGAFTPLYSETWNASVPLTALYFELKGGTSNLQTSPGTVIFDNFRAAKPQ
jgi:hypothetical protein